jgi:hypothetical protein
VETKLLTKVNKLINNQTEIMDGDLVLIENLEILGSSKLADPAEQTKIEPKETKTLP